jgi:hypothetical protein
MHPFPHFKDMEKYRYWIIKMTPNYQYTGNEHAQEIFSAGSNPNGTPFTDIFFITDDKNTLLYGTTSGHEKFVSNSKNVEKIIETKIIGKLDDRYISRSNDEFLKKCNIIFRKYLDAIFD